MGSRSSRIVRRLLGWIIGLGIVAGAIYLWGDDLIYFATGGDILDSLRTDLASVPTSTPSPIATPLPTAQPTPSSASLTGGGGQEQVTFGGDLRDHVSRYTVQPGDTLTGIAARFDLNPNTIFWANTETLQDNVHLLLVGTNLFILPVNGVYHLSDGTLSIADIADLYSVTPDDIIQSPYNELSDASPSTVPPAGLRIVVPGGRRQYISWDTPIQGSADNASANPTWKLNPGACPLTYIGTGGLNQWANPLGDAPYFVTQNFEPWHSGIDLAAPLGTPIYAAETGIVVFAGWHLNGYGNLVVIDHGDGWTTYYAHLEDRYVDCGQQVYKGQILGLMGQTGNSSGSHLHFEIRYNHYPRDPRLYLYFRRLDPNYEETTTQGGGG